MVSLVQCKLIIIYTCSSLTIGIEIIKIVDITRFRTQNNATGINVIAAKFVHRDDISVVGNIVSGTLSLQGNRSAQGDDIAITIILTCAIFNITMLSGQGNIALHRFQCRGVYQIAIRCSQSNILASVTIIAKVSQTFFSNQGYILASLQIHIVNQLAIGSGQDDATSGNILTLIFSIISGGSKLWHKLFEIVEISHIAILRLQGDSAIHGNNIASIVNSMLLENCIGFIPNSNGAFSCSSTASHNRGL